MGLLGASAAAVFALLALLFLLVLTGLPHAQASTIASDGPLTIHIGDGESAFSCAVDYAGVGHQFYGGQGEAGNACGTFLLVGSSKYGPADLPFGYLACTPNPCQTFAAASGKAVTGTGTGANPFQLYHRATAGAVVVEQRDSYVAGTNSYATNITLSNPGPAAQSGILWRAGDCWVGTRDDPDYSYGWVDPGDVGGVACSQSANATSGRLIEWVPRTPGSQYMAARYDTVWSQIGSDAMFGNTCSQCTRTVDNGAGLSWAWTLQPGQSASFASELRFSTTGVSRTHLAAAFGFDNSRVSCENSPVLFTDASMPTGEVASWQWNFGDGLAETGRNPIHIYAKADTYPVTLTVTGRDGGQSSVTRQVSSVGDPDCCPTLARLSEYAVDEGQTLTFHVPAADFEGDQILYTLGGLPAAASVSPAGRFSWATTAGDAGDHRATLRVGDALSTGCTAAQAFTIHVQAAPPGSGDSDQDGVPDGKDNCPAVANRDQADVDQDGTGDACTAGNATAPPPPPATDLRDQDRDGVPDITDNCVQTANAGQSDLDGDAVGDACDIDVDGDGIINAVDNCPLVPNPSQADLDHNGDGDACATANHGAVLGGLARAGGGGQTGTPAAAAHLQERQALGIGLAAAICIGLAAVLVFAVLRRANR